MSENYLMINGKRLDLTEEQIEQLGLNKNQGIFDRQEKGCDYYYIKANGTVQKTIEKFYEMDNDFYKIANYCTSEEIIEQRALHETLSRLLWRFSMQNDGDKLDWRYRGQKKYFVTYDYYKRNFCVDFFETIYGATLKPITIYFHTVKTAQRAIDEIIKPFMKEHPEFIW